MAADEINWFDRALDAVIAIAGGLSLILGGAIVRLWRHEERIKALEDHHRAKVEAINSLGEKVDANHTAVTERIDALGEAIRADLRIIMARCLSIGHEK